MERPETAPETLTLTPADRELLEQLERDVFDLAELEEHPNLNPGINIYDAVALLLDFENGLLAKHDDTCSKGDIRRGGPGSTLRDHVQAWQIARVLRLVGQLRFSPIAELPAQKGYWLYCLWLYCLQRAKPRTEDETDRPTWPYLADFNPAWSYPTDAHFASAFVVYANLLHREVFAKDPS